MKILILILLLALPSFADDIIVETGMDPVENGANFQDALDTANCGDNIILQAGATYRGISFDYSFLIPDRGCTSEYITVRTSDLAGLAAEGERIRPADHIASMPKIEGDISSFGGKTIAFDDNADYWKFIGLEITNNGEGGLIVSPVMIGISPHFHSGSFLWDAAAEAESVDNVIFDRCFVHPDEIDAFDLNSANPYRTAAKGINVEGRDHYIINSYIAGFTGFYESQPETLIDSMGIFMISGPGPLHITNNYIEALYNNFFWGGGGGLHLKQGAVVGTGTLTSATLTDTTDMYVGEYISIGPLVGAQVMHVTAIDGNDIEFEIISDGVNSPDPSAPTDGQVVRWKGMNITGVYVTRNSVFKNDAWEAFFPEGSTYKGWFETKDGVDMYYDGNYFYGGNRGTGLSLSARNQSGFHPWSQTTNINFTNNIIEKFSAMMVAQFWDDTYPIQPRLSNWTFRNNLAIAADAEGEFAWLQAGSNTHGGNVYVTHNTIISHQTGLWTSSGMLGDFHWKDNILTNSLGIHCVLASSNFDACFPDDQQIEGNLWVGPEMMGWPHCTDQGGEIYTASNNCVDAWIDVEFMDYTGDITGNYRLDDMSPFKGTATDMTDPGVDYVELLAAQAGGGISSDRGRGRGRARGRSR